MRDCASGVAAKMVGINSGVVGSTCVVVIPSDPFHR